MSNVNHVQELDGGSPVTVLLESYCLCVTWVDLSSLCWYCCDGLSSFRSCVPSNWLGSGEKSLVKVDAVSLQSDVIVKAHSLCDEKRFIRIEFIWFCWMFTLWFCWMFTLRFIIRPISSSISIPLNLAGWNFPENYIRIIHMLVISCGTLWKLTYHQCLL